MRAKLTTTGETVDVEFHATERLYCDIDVFKTKDGRLLPSFALVDEDGNEHAKEHERKYLKLAKNAMGWNTNADETLSLFNKERLQYIAIRMLMQCRK